MTNSIDLEVYQILSKQEQVKEQSSYLQRIINNFSILLNYLQNDETLLEHEIKNDNDLFMSPIVKSCCSYRSFEFDGTVFKDIFTFYSKNPLRSLLDNSAISNKLIKELEVEIEEIPLIIFIHGLGGNLQQFDQQFEYFKEFTDILSFDLPGFGNSLNFKTNLSSFKLDVENYINFIKVVLNSMGFLNRKIIVIGHSFGTQLSIKLIESLPNLKGLVFLNPPKKSVSNKSLFKFFYSFPFVFNLFRKFDRLNNINSVSVKRVFGDDFSDLNEFIKFKQFKFNLLTNTNSFLNLLINWDYLPTVDIINLIKSFNLKFNNKVLIIDSECDKITPKGGEFLHDLVGNSNSDYVVLPNLGHNSMLENPDAVNQLLYDYFIKTDFRLNKDYIQNLRRNISQKV